MKNFIEAYHQYVDNTEAPSNFHFWTAMSTVSALLGRKCYVPQGYFTIFPQLYVVLVGPPGLKKSSALNAGKNLLRSLEKFPLAPEATTREALLEVMGENKMEYQVNGKPLTYYQASIFASELSEFIGGRHINQSMMSFLTAVWDEPYFEYRTKNKGTVKLPSPYLTLLAATTPGWITSNLKSDIITDGFARRTIFVFEDSRHKLVDWPETTEKESEAYRVLKREIQRIHSIGGQFSLTEEAREAWREFYISLQEKVLDKDETVQSYYSSKHVLVLKLCMCLSACFRSDRIIDSELLVLAQKCFADTEKNLEKVFSGLGRNELKQYQVKILDKIVAAGEKGISKRELTAQFYRDVNLNELLETLQSLEESGQIVMTASVPGQPPVFKAKNAKKDEPRVNLLELASRYRPKKEKPLVSSSVVINPIEEKQEAVQQKLNEQFAQGVLLKAKRPVVIEDTSTQPEAEGPLDS